MVSNGKALPLRRRFFLSLIILAFSFASCEYEAQLTYKIKNSSTTPLKVICTNTDGIATTDTFNIETGKETMIALIPQGIGLVKKYKETGTSLRDFSRMDIFKNDTIISRINFLNTARWQYVENSKYTADYLLTVTNADF
jgi:hypothetical protein